MRRHPSPTALKPFPGLSAAMRGLERVHSYTMDLGFALGLLDLTKRRSLVFCVDATGYRPVRLSKTEWKKIARSKRFNMQPKFCHKGKGVFHSKAWMFSKGLLLGSANLSIREARDNLNFWCWMPGTDSKPHARYIGKNDGGTVIIDLDHVNRRDQAKTAWEALKREIIGKGRVLTNCVIVSPERLSRTLLSRLSPHMALHGTCCVFLRSQNYAVKAIPGRQKWKVLNFIPSDRSIGLHGKSIYFEWQKGTQRGAILYVGSANFTIHGYDAGRNHESGVLITGAGNTVRGIQDAALALLGRTHPVAQTGDAWATDRFNGRWKRIEPPQEDAWEEERPYLSQDDQDYALFLMGLKTTGHNQLSFPPKYGSKTIVEAELKGYGGYPQIWRASTRARRRFTHVFWSPPLSLKLTLRHGRTVKVDVPPLEGLMNDGKRGSELLELLFEEPEPLEGRLSNKGSGTLMDSAASVYAGQRVLFPWRAILSSKQGSAHLCNKSKLDRAIRSITSHLQLSFGNTEDGQLLQRKMKILQSTLTKLRQSI